MVQWLLSKELNSTIQAQFLEENLFIPHSVIIIREDMNPIIFSSSMGKY